MLFWSDYELNIFDFGLLVKRKKQTQSIYIKLREIIAGTFNYYFIFIFQFIDSPTSLHYVLEI